jgi:hypothetical protein
VHKKPAADLSIQIKKCQPPNLEKTGELSRITLCDVVDFSHTNRDDRLSIFEVDPDSGRILSYTRVVREDDSTTGENLFTSFC